MNDLENRMVLPVADDMRDGAYECCECLDCGGHFYREDRIYIQTGPHDGEYTCPICGSAKLDAYNSARELNDALVDIARSLSLRNDE